MYASMVNIYIYFSPDLLWLLFVASEEVSKGIFTLIHFILFRLLSLLLLSLMRCEQRVFGSNSNSKAISWCKLKLDSYFIFAVVIFRCLISICFLFWFEFVVCCSSLLYCNACRQWTPWMCHLPMICIITHSSASDWTKCFVKLLCLSRWYLPAGQLANRPGLLRYHYSCVCFCIFLQ